VVRVRGPAVFDYLTPDPRQLTSDFRRVILERESYCQLHLPRIADTLPQEAVEIKQARRGQRILISAGRQRIDSVIRVKGIEHLHRGNQSEAFPESEGSRETPIERNIVVVFPQRVSIGTRRRNKSARVCWLGGSRLNTWSKLKAPGQL